MELSQQAIHNHGMVIFSPEFSQLCQPIFNTTPINYIGANRMYHDGGRCYLNSDPLWAETYIKNQYHLAGTEENIVKSAQTKKIPWYLSNIFHINPESENLYKGCIAYNYANGITLIENGKDFVELFHICAEGGSERVNDYLVHNIDYLWQILLYLKEKIYTSKILKQVYQKKHYYDDGILPSIAPLKLNVENGLPSLNVKKYFLGGFFDGIAFTQREMDCLILLYQLKSYKEQAQILKISPRTVETHIENIKRKTNLTSNMALLLELAKNNSFNSLLANYNL